MLRGYLDVVTSSGHVDGWAYDTDAQSSPMTLSVRVDGEEIASGVANRYRADLIDAGCGTGWCAFRFRITCSIGRLRRSPSALVALPAQQPLFHADGLALAENNDLPLTRVEDIARNDPTLVASIEQLRGCGAIFTDLIRASGLESFIRAAYIYALGRPADPTGIEHYVKMISNDELTPYGLLYALCDSEEFRAVPRLLIAPTEPGFIFTAL